MKIIHISIFLFQILNTFCIVPPDEEKAICSLIESIKPLNTIWNDSLCGTPCNFPGITCATNESTKSAINQNVIQISVAISDQLQPISSLTPLIGKLTHLVGLNIQATSIGGTLPTQIGNLTLLNTLDLSQNLFSGTIPTQLGLLTSLTRLNLFSNNLLGSIPTELGKLVSLKELSLNKNNIDGVIPSHFSNLVNLTSLSLDDTFTCLDYTIFPPVFQKYCGLNVEGNGNISGNIVVPFVNISYSSTFEAKNVNLTTKTLSISSNSTLEIQNSTLKVEEIIIDGNLVIILGNTHIETNGITIKQNSTLNIIIPDDFQREETQLITFIYKNGSFSNVTLTQQSCQFSYVEGLFILKPNSNCNTPLSASSKQNIPHSAIETVLFFLIFLLIK